MKEANTIESLIKSGHIGAAFGAFLSKDKEIGAIIVAAIAATLKANEEAKKTNIPFYVEEDGKLVEVHSTGQKRFIKNIEKSAMALPQQFKLK